MGILPKAKDKGWSISRRFNFCCTSRQLRRKEDG
jgi:hypothetical protein